MKSRGRERRRGQPAFLQAELHHLLTGGARG
jgi:hypothetical protein